MLRSLMRTLTFGLLVAMFSACGATDGDDPPPDELYAYVISSSGVFAFSINAETGALTTVPGSPFAAGESPVSVTGDPFGKFVYVANSYSGDISAFSIDAANGALIPIGTFPAGLYYPASMTVHPSGQFVYVACLGSEDISLFNIDSATGALTAPSLSRFSVGESPVSLAIHPSGKFVYATNDHLGNVYAFTVDAVSGALEAVPGSPFPSGVNAWTVAIHPSGQFAFVKNGDSVSVFRIDASTGGLTGVPGSPFPLETAGTQSASMAIDPTGTFAFVTSESANSVRVWGNVSVMMVNRISGALSVVAGSPFYVESPCDEITVDPSGKFAYVVNGDNISAFSINSGTGALTRLAGWTFAEGVTPNGIAVVRIRQGTR